MPIPPEFRYADEKDFVQRFLIPLLQRLGFSPVNYHGTWELGKDLIFAEFDRFGHIRYHAMQAKYVDSIGLGDARTLIDQCEQAFGSPFVHPHTGEEQRISTFYAANGGSISDAARKTFFDRLSPKFGANVRLLDGRALIALDRQIAFHRTETVRNCVAGLDMEFRDNRDIGRSLHEILQKRASGSPDFPGYRLRLNAVEEYMVHPVLMDAIPLELVNEYWYEGHACNLVLEHAQHVLFYTAESREASLHAEVPRHLAAMDRLASVIENRSKETLRHLGSLTQL